MTKRYKPGTLGLSGEEQADTFMIDQLSGHESIATYRYQHARIAWQVSCPLQSTAFALTSTGLNMDESQVIADFAAALCNLILESPE